MSYSQNDHHDSEKKHHNMTFHQKNLKNAFEQLMQQFQSEDDQEKQWLIQNCGNPLLQEILKDTTVMMLHVLDTIGQFEPVNGVTISKKMGILKGTLSKNAKKLISKNLIRTESLAHNKKEVLYCLTSLGRELFHIHQSMHQKIEIHFDQFLEKYNATELQLITQFLQDTARISWVNLEPSPDRNKPVDHR